MSDTSTSPYYRTDVGITLADRLRHGFLTVDEVCALKRCSRSRFYEDARSGVVAYEKDGRLTRIRGPVAARYLGLET